MLDKKKKERPALVIAAPAPSTRRVKQSIQNRAHACLERAAPRVRLPGGTAVLQRQVNHAQHYRFELGVIGHLPGKGGERRGGGRVHANDVTPLPMHGRREYR